MSRSPDQAVDGKRADAQRLRDSGMSYREIGEQLGISKAAAHEYCNPDLVVAYNQRRLDHYLTTPAIQAQTKDRLRRRRQRGDG